MAHLPPPPTTNTSSLPRRRLLRIKPAAEYTSLSPWKLRELVHDGKIPFVQEAEGSPFLFDQRDLDDWIERNKRINS